MPAVMTYSSLLDDVTLYCEKEGNADFTAQLPRVLMLAETAIAADLKTLGVQQVLEANLALGNNTLEKPAYWRNTLSFKIQLSNGRHKHLLLRSLEFCQQYAPNASSNDEPVYYADYNYNNFMVAPTPNLSYAFELVFFPRLTPLDSTTQVNWLTINAPHLLFQRVMAEAHDLLKNADRSAEWRGKYDASLAALGLEDNARQADRGTVVK